ncbi:hypothetical protein [Paenibacillus sp. RC67]|uniref:hypothetical protein n=1 Tax=Paenibacillus sp. RC67 TaxID=3039392 RepID=UPI0024AD91CC|nr:hypothetical protein [Paenibacillus sp. RC67]
MDKFKPMPMVSPAMEMPGPMPNMNAPMPMPYSPSFVSPSYTAPTYAAPINVHANFEAYNIIEPKKHHHHHGHCHRGCGWTSVGTILVLYILLVIILRGVVR